MLCPKCGREYEGNRCLRCEGPEIIVNNADYLRRKQAYEQKQAGKSESAFLHNEAEGKNTGEDYTPQYALKKIKEYNNKLKEKKSAQKSSVRNNSEQKKSAQKSSVRNNSEQNNDVRIEKKKRLCGKKRWLIPVLLLLVILAVVGIYKLAVRKNYVLYTSYNSKIYNASGLESSLVCEQSSAVYAIDGKNFYVKELERDIAGTLVESMASDDGHAYSAVSYDEAESAYSLYVWKGEKCKKVATDSMKKELIYTAQDGTVIYRSTDVIDKLLNTGKTALYIYKLADNKKEANELTLLSEDIISVNVYSGVKKIVYLTADRELYVTEYSQEITKKCIQTEVDSVYAAKENSRYSYNAPSVCMTSDETAFAYSQQGKVYYHDLSSRKNEDLYVTTVNASGFELFYEKNQAFYIINNKKLYNGSDYTELATLTARQDALYLKGNLLFVDDEKRLMVVHDGNAKTIAENVQPGSLIKVDNKSEAIAYIADNSLIYRENISDKGYMLAEMKEYDGVVSVIYYKNRLYFYNSSNKLCATSLKGKNIDVIGDVDSFWLGTKLE